MATATQLTARDLGVPVKSLNWVRLFPGRTADGKPSLLATMGQDAGGVFVTDIDLATGHCTQHGTPIEGATFPTAAHRNERTGVIYIGSAYSGHLHRYDPAHPERGLENLGAIDKELAIFPCKIDESPDGMIWISAYGGCSLTRFNPKTSEFTRFGRMDDVDQYLYVSCGSDGTIAAIVRVCNVHVILFDPATGKRRTVGPTIDTNKSGGALSSEKIEIVKAADGLLYLRSHEGNLRLKGMDAVPIDEVPEAEPTPTLPDGSKAEFTDVKEQQHRTVQITAQNGSTRTLKLDWVGHGTNIFVMELGPDGKLYGSSILPEHFFECDTDGKNMIDHGQCSESMGEAYSMGSFGGKLYIASYPAARFSIYDPSKPYRYGEDEGANPRDIGRVDDVAYRPRAMLCGPVGKVWVGSVPDYGMWGGTLASYDPATGKLASRRHLIQDASVVSLEWIPELNQILVGTSIHGGSGTKPRIKDAAFVYWDPHADKAVATETFGLSGIDGILDIKRASDGSVYAVVVYPSGRPAGQSQHTAELLRLDVVKRKILDRSPLGDAAGWPLEVALREGPDGALYGATSLEFYRIVPGTAKREVLWSTPMGDEREYLRVSGPIVGRRWYFASLHRLRGIDF